MAGKPLIGITSRTVHRRSESGHYVWSKVDFVVPQNHPDVIFRAGGTPILLPSIVDEGYCERVLSEVDGLFLMGGDDMDPALFNEEPRRKLGLVDVQKGEFEFLLTKKALAMDMPVLGICGGHQMLNVVLGGDIYQDIESQTDSKIKHRQEMTRISPSHYVDIEEGTRLHKIHGVTELRVNSTHHQAIRNLGDGLAVTSRARDGIIESIEAPEKRFAVGVQWHPESLAEEYPIFQKLFDEFVGECSR